MAKDDTRRWRGWRTSQPSAPVTGSQPKKRAGTRRGKRNKVNPWYWVRAKKTLPCPGECGAIIGEGDVIAFSRPRKMLCEACAKGRGLKVTTSKQLAEERKAKIIESLRKAAG